MFLTSCTPVVSMVNQTMTISLAIYDAFGSICRGLPYNLTVFPEQRGNLTCALISGQTTVKTNASGIAVFSNLQFRGQVDSVCDLTFVVTDTYVTGR
jgi:hypothetical protein